MHSIAYHQRLRIARATLVLAIVAALLAWVTPLDVVAPGKLGRPVTSHVQYTRSTSALLRVNLFALSQLLPAGHYPSDIETRLAYYAIVVFLSLYLVAAPFCVAWIPRANLMKWLWILIDLGVVAALIYGWREADYYYITGISSGSFSTSIHLHFLPGFYLACLAALLHVTGLFLIPSAKSVDRPTLPFSE